MKEMLINAVVSRIGMVILTALGTFMIATYPAQFAILCDPPAQLELRGLTP